MLMEMVLVGLASIPVPRQPMVTDCERVTIEDCDTRCHGVPKGCFPTQIVCQDGMEDCTLSGVLKVLREVAQYTPSPSDVTPAIYRTPAAQLRHEADMLERREMAYERLRATLRACEGVE